MKMSPKYTKEERKVKRRNWRYVQRCYTLTDVRKNLKVFKIQYKQFWG